jgi:hypothetical protein
VNLPGPLSEGVEVGASSIVMSEKDPLEGALEVEEWILANRISDAGAKKLASHQIGDLDTLMLFQERDIEYLKLSLADALRFRAGISRLHEIPALEDDTGLSKPEGVSKEEESKEGVSKPSVDPDQKVYSLKDVEKLLAGKQAVAAGGVVPAESSTSVLSSQGALLTAFASLLSKPSVPATSSDPTSALLALLAGVADSANKGPDVRELMRDLLNVDGSVLNSKGEKALLPVNFLSCVRGTQNNDEVVHQGRDLNLVLQPSTKRVTPEKLSFGQWAGANARILDKLTTSGRLTPVQVSEYLDYNRKIGDLLQLYTPSSVFLLDHNHRLEVHQSEKKRWNKIDATLQSSHLRLKDVRQPLDSGSSGRSSVSSAGSTRRRKRGVCWNYNSAEGCRVGKERCQYEHVDSGESSARSSGIAERAPRFQKAATPSPST